MTGPAFSDTVEETGLGDAAAAGLDHIDGEAAEGQGEFEETQATKVKFVGMAYDAFEESIQIGDEMVFIVKARCVGVGDEAMKTGGRRHLVKMDVQSVLPQSD